MRLTAALRERRTPRYAWRTWLAALFRKELRQAASGIRHRPTDRGDFERRLSRGRERERERKNKETTLNGAAHDEGNLTTSRHFLLFFIRNPSLHRSPSPTTSYSCILVVLLSPSIIITLVRFNPPKLTSSPSLPSLGVFPLEK
jgi:hypothetical protein